MATRLTDSPLYAHLWSTEELSALLGDRGRMQSWLDILVALARAQAALGIIPERAAEAIAASASVDALDIDYVAEQTRHTAHSTLGLIRGLQRILPAHAAEYVYFGATVQDLTDTWFGVLMRDVGAIAWRDLHRIEDTLLRLAAAHRDTLMAGRTHGQLGVPITFGFKAAGWADEVRRHIERLADGRRRWLVGQLGGAVGALAFFGDDGVALRARFCAEAGLADPGMSWLTARDRIAEFGGVLAMVCATLARIGTEVYELARTEIGELAEPHSPGAVSSITMPHKRNPEASEHLDTLARLARSSATVLTESMVGVHERDGRAWKAEWVALPEVSLLTGAALRLARGLLEGIEVHADVMAANLHRYGEILGSERILACLSARLGKHRAQQVLQEALADAPPDGVVEELVRRGIASKEEVADWLDDPGVRTAAQMVDEVVARSRAARAAGPADWPAPRDIGRAP